MKLSLKNQTQDSLNKSKSTKKKFKTHWTWNRMSKLRK